jgi:hypothetical protein
MSLLPRVKNSTMLLSTLLTSNFAASRPNRWQVAAIVEALSFLGKDRGVGNAIEFQPKMNSDRDYRHNCGGNLEGIGEQLYRQSGGCIQGSIIPK